jgi:hypothetical protein
MFRQCASLELEYDKLTSSIKEGKEQDITALDEKINSEASFVLEEFLNTDSNLNIIDDLLKDFSKAVNTDVDINFNSSFIVFSEKDYTENKAQLEKLKGIREVLNSEQFTSKQPIEKLQQLTDKYLISDLKSYSASIKDLKQNLNVSILLLEDQAKTGLQNARDNFVNSTNRDDLYLSLTKATDSLKEDYFNRALIYSHHVLASVIISEPFYFPYEYLIILLAVGGFLGYMLLKPKKPKLIKKKKLRQLS